MRRFKTIRNIFVGILTTIILVVFIYRTITPISAQTASSDITNSSSDTPVSVNNRVQLVFNGFVGIISCQLAGVNVSYPKQTCTGINTIDPKLGFKQTKSYGALGLMAESISFFYANMPAHTSDYFAYLKDNFGIIKHSYAATTGSGYDSIKPLMNIWIAIRNLTYLFIALVFIIIGFAIMLRVKIDPRTVMTIQNQIPKIIIALLLITFSFAISGFLIDLMYILIYLFFSIYASIGISPTLTPAVFQNNLTLGLANNITPPGVPLGIFGLSGSVASSLTPLVRGFLGLTYGNNGWVDFVSGPFQPLGNLVGGSISGTFSFTQFLVDLGSWFIAGKQAWDLADLGATVSASLPFGIGAITGTGAIIAAGVAFWAMFTGIETAATIVIPFGLVWLLIMIGLFIAMFRLLFALLTAYVTILYYIVLAPIFIFFGLIPGAEGGGFSSWIRNLGANLFAFPLTAAIFMLGNAMIQEFSAPGSNNVFIPPMLGGGTIPVGVLLSITVIFVASNGPQMAKDMFKVKEDKNAGALGLALGTGVKTITGGVKAGTEYGAKDAGGGIVGWRSITRSFIR